VAVRLPAFLESKEPEAEAETDSEPMKPERVPTLMEAEVVPS